MQNSLSTRLQRVLTLLAALLILKVTASVVLGYGDYFPANFESDFLRGRQFYFSGIYRTAFYLHIASGPVTLLLGLLLISEPLRTRFPKWHRSLGKTQALLVLSLLVPSGLVLAYYAKTGAVAAVGFSLLAILTGLCVLMGWRSAMKRQFVAHRRWMFRCFLLLCSAVALRLIGGLASVTGVGLTWSYPLAAWASWLVPLAAFELGGTVKQSFACVRARDADQYMPVTAASSSPAIVISARRAAAGVSSGRK